MLKKEKYTINRKNLLAHELIGLNCEVKKSTDENKIGLKGKVLDETKNVLVVETRKGARKLPKKEVTFVFKLGKEKIEVDGKKLVARPEERLKIFWRKRHERM